MDWSLDLMYVLPIDYLFEKFLTTNLGAKADCLFRSAESVSKVPWEKCDLFVFENWLLLPNLGFLSMWLKLNLGAPLLIYSYRSVKLNIFSLLLMSTLLES